MSGFLGGVGVVGDDCVKLEGFEKGPFFVWREKAVLHQLVEGFEALNVYPDGVHVAFLGSVIGVLFGEADASKVAHGSLILDVGCVFLLPVPILASFRLVCSAAAFSVDAVPGISTCVL